MNPLTPHAWGVLAKLAYGPLPRREVNAGVFERFWREGLAYQVEREIHITPAGRAKLDGRP